MARPGLVVAAFVALALGGCGGDEHPGRPSGKPTSTPMSSARQQDRACERAREATRRRHPGAYVGDCNFGEASLTIP